MPRPQSPSRSSTASGPGGGSAKTATKRLLKEMDTWRKEQSDEKGIERLGPISDENLLEWESVINGQGVGAGYDGKALPPPLLSLELLSRRTLARLHLRAADVPPAGAQDALRHAHCAPQHCAADGRDMPGPAQGRVDAGVQRAGVRARRAHAAELSRDGQPAQRGCRGAAEGRRRRWHAEARRVLVCR
ncbi:ubiquitin-conjugating enzyme E2 4, partial [Metarhizium brunneum ARSEF 3297]